MSDAYKAAGVDKAAGYDAVDKIKTAVNKTHNAQVLNKLGGFGALYDLGQYEQPVLVSGTDGVGTKIMVALKHNQLAGIGQDCFAMCANDILCHGAKPLFFLDYLACSSLEPEVAAEIITGMAAACEATNTALVGGEMAEMPGMYQKGDYDIAGFCVGVVEKSNIIDGSSVTDGDVIIGLPSSGVHSNGFSLIRRLYPDTAAEFDGQPLYQTLLAPTKLYINAVHALLSNVTVKGLAHITGGGLPENLPRSFPGSLSAQIDTQAIPQQPIFQALREHELTEDDLWGTFNMGVGFCAIVSPADQAAAIASLEAAGEQPFVLGKMVSRSAESEAVCFN